MHCTLIRERSIEFLCLMVNLNLIAHEMIYNREELEVYLSLTLGEFDK